MDSNYVGLQVRAQLIVKHSYSDEPQLSFVIYNLYIKCISFIWAIKHCRQLSYFYVTTSVCEWMVSEWVTKWESKWISGWVSEWMDEWATERISEWLSEWERNVESVDFNTAFDL